MTKSKIAVSLITEHQEYQRFQAADARQAGKRVDCEVEVVFADGRSVRQIEQLFNLIRLPEDKRPGGIIVEPISGDGHVRVAEAAARAGVGWVTLAYHFDYIDDLRAKHPGIALSSVATDQVGIGRIQGQQFRALLPMGGTMLYLQGPASSVPAKRRAQGMQEEIGGLGINAQMLYGDWTEKSGEEAMARWLRLRGSQTSIPKVIGCQNDSMAVGVRRALEGAFPGWEDIVITGCDGLPKEGQAQVNARRLGATVVSPSCAGPAVELVAKHLTNQEPAPARVSLNPTSYPPIERISPVVS